MEQKLRPNEYNVRRRQEENTWTLARTDDEAAGNPVNPWSNQMCPAGNIREGKDH
jgi:hypothetical protein